MRKGIRNPYVKLAEIMRQEGARNNPGSWGLGKVVQEEPLQVEYMGVVLENEQLVHMNKASYEVDDELAIMPNLGYDSFIVMGKKYKPEAEEGEGG